MNPILLSKRLSAVSLFVALAVFGIGCAAGVADADPPALVIYAARSESLIGPLIDQFSDQKGIEVKVKYGGTSELVTTLLEEGENSPADVYYTRDPGGLSARSVS